MLLATCIHIFINFKSPASVAHKVDKMATDSYGAVVRKKQKSMVYSGNPFAPPKEYMALVSCNAKNSTWLFGKMELRHAIEPEVLWRRIIVEKYGTRRGHRMSHEPQGAIGCRVWKGIWQLIAKS